MSYFFISCLFLFVLFLFVSRLFPKLRGAEEKPKSDNNTAQVKYDVFVSFRGEDIRQGFLSHLIYTFQREKINAFVDDRLVRGDEIWPSLVQAIEGSFISLIIFSQNYAFSPWCLEEIVTILECREKNGQIVIPVFYHVEPKHVRHQLGSYKNALAKHGRRYKTKLQTWRQALNKSANFSGIHSSKFQNDAELLKDIVDLVLTRLGKHAVNLNGLVGIDTKIADVESLISKHKEPKDIRLIGIWGMGGIGKTTLAEQVFNKLRVDNKYDGCYFLANEREQSSKHGIIILKERIFSELLGNAVKIDTENSLPNDVVRRIGCTKVLIVLDDVNDSDHLEKLLGTLDNFGSGSRIIVTTRDEQVLNANKADDTYKLRELGFDKALELFNLNAFSQSDQQREYDELSKRVVDYAQGIPLVLKVLAHLLQEKEKEVWESQLYKLKKMPHKKIYDVMKLSFEDLDRKEQQIFLDLACFFLRTRIQVDVSYLKSLLKDSGNDISVAAGLEKLKDKALITFSEDNFVSMHDSLQEMAWEIVRQESIDNPGSRSRLWDPDDIYEALENDKGTEAVRSICIESPTIENHKLSPHVFSKMSRLRFLEVCVEYDHYCFNQHTILAKGLQYLATELRFLDWWRYPLISLPENFSTEKLVILRLENSKIEKLWDGVKNLVNLKELDLSDSEMLKELPDLSEATNLEALFLGGCLLLSSVHQSVFSLGNENIEKLPSSIQNLTRLQILNVNFCSSLQILPELPQFLKALYAKDCESLQCLPELPQFLETLNLEDSSSLQTLPELPPCLKDLNVGSCKSVKTLPELPPCLKVLNVGNCKSMKTLPELVQFLETLNVEDCSSLQTLPELPPFLKYLDVGNCKSMKTLPELPPFLKYLNVRNCESMETLPELPPFLETLNVKCCTSLQTLQELPMFLKTLNINYCFSLQILPELPPSLVVLNTQSCISLQTLLNLPRSLKTLDFRMCKSLQTLPELPPHLVALNVMNCNSLQTLPELPHFLETLDIGCCTSLQSLPEFPPYLKVVNARDCTSLKTVSPSMIVQELTKSRKHVLFWNCSSLDEYSLVAIGLDAQINMMKSANRYLSSGNPFDAKNYDDFRNYQAVYVYPGSNVLEWLEYKTINDYIIVDLSSAAPPSPSFGFIFCFVLGKYYGERHIEGLHFNITVSDVEGEDEKESVRMYIEFWDLETELDHVCIMYDQRCSEFLNRRAKNQTRFKIEFPMYTHFHSPESTCYDLLQQVLKRFGVSPISTSTYNNFIQQM